MLTAIKDRAGLEVWLAGLSLEIKSLLKGSISESGDRASSYTWMSDG